MPNPLFSLCHATRRFPGWRACARIWYERCDEPAAVQYCLGVDRKDDRTQTFLPFPKFMECGIYFDRRDSVPDSAGKAWNAAVRASRGEFIITVGDDLFPPPHWDTEIKKAIPDFSKEAVLAPDLSGDYGIITFCFLTRPYLERLTRDHGYDDGAWYPEYYGMRADDDFTACARLDGVVVEAPWLKFEHRHPTYGTAEWDDTYRWQHREEAFELGDRVLTRRSAEGFRL
jgi:hypothetical protein